MKITVSVPYVAIELLLFVLFRSWVVAGEAVCPDKTDPCMDDENWAECQKLVADGCTQLLIAESCPLQFFCDTSSNNPDDPNGLCPPVDECFMQEQYDECIALVKEGCTEIVTDKKCPVSNVGCFESNNPDDPNGLCPPVGNCILQEQYEECIALVKQGCTGISYDKRCPVGGFRCYEQNELCPPVDGSCVLQEQFDECLQLVNDGCTDITIAESCPVQFGCNIFYDPCPPVDGNCVLEEQYEECKALVDSGCTQIATLKSCPVQFECTALPTTPTGETPSLFSQMLSVMFQRIFAWFRNMLG